MKTDETAVVPDEIILQPDDYDLPGFTPGWAKAHQDRMKQSVKVTRRQIQYFGERGVPWSDIEAFYGVDRKTLQRYYLADYEKGKANTNIALRNKMAELALAGNVTLLIFIAKNRLNYSDNGPTKDDEGNPTATATTEELLQRAESLLTQMKTKAPEEKKQEK